MNRGQLLLGMLVAITMASCGPTKESGSSAPAVSGSASANVTTITVQADKPGVSINPAMWGAFFEDINFGADGGLYAQMVKNGMFEFPDGMMGWILVRPSLAKGSATVIDDKPFKETNPHFVRITSAAPAPIGISNEGFRGMGVRAGDAYDFSAQIRHIDGASKVSVEIVGADGATLASAPLTGISDDWGKISVTLHPNDTDGHARLAIFLEGPGTVDFDMVSLFPEKTWKNRLGGLRADMVQALADLKPGFLRFPGGCIVEGSDLSKRYQWKNTIGPIEDRKLVINRWNYEFKHRPTPDYYQSFGLGFFEFFQLCEDIGAQPLPILNCGMACQFNSGELCKPEDLQNYIQDALDLIEFANGPATSAWGSKRAAMGHPEPFHLTMIGVGNEQWGPQYIDHLQPFIKAIKAAHPEIMLVCASGPSPDDERFEYLWPKLNELHADIVDQHCYANPVWFLSNTHRFDDYDRNGPKVFFGEYGAQSVAIVSTKNRNNLECALSEAAYMTGLERNADVVRMASYAPLFSNVSAWQWTPDLIWTDSLHVMRTPNYYVQQMYTHNHGDRVLPTSNDSPVREILPGGRIGVGTDHASAEFKDVQVKSNDSAGQVLLDSSFASNDEGWMGGDNWHVTNGAYQQGDPNAITNSFAGDPQWKNYMLTLKARKLDGAGALVITTCMDNNGTWARWVLGGWNNSQNAIVTHYAEQDQFLAKSPGSLENNRWYDVKISVSGDEMNCYFDGALVQSAKILHRDVPALFTSASKDDQTGDIILKVVNPGNEPSAGSINLQGVDQVATTAQVITLCADNPSAENSFENLGNVTPQPTDLPGIAPQFKYTFKPHSFTIIRLGNPKMN
jgi:alpha-N-arabinofuranosidase